MSDTYRIVRMYMRGGHRTVKTGLTLEEAHTHCRNKETSSRTCTLAKNKELTKRNGPWFDGYERE
jgi:hypothetical protein